MQTIGFKKLIKSVVYFSFAFFIIMILILIAEIISLQRTKTTSVRIVNGKEVRTVKYH
jgi:hypothetical protein